MLFYDQRIMVFFFFLTFIMNVTYSKSWDIAVTIGKEVHFFSCDGALTKRIKNRHATSLSGIAYDKSTHRLFLGDSRNNNASIFSKDTQLEGSEINILLHGKQGFWNIVNIIYDSETQSLIWADSKNKGIFTLDVFSENKVSEPKMILNLSRENPQAISLDACNRRLFWTNSNKSGSSISSSNLDGTNYNNIILDNLYEPIALTFDHITRKLYWIDDDEGIHYKIERSNFDGSNRELLVHGKHQQPFDIAVDHNNIYWTDSVYGSIWSISKNIKPNDEPRIWKSFRHLNEDINPTTLITQDNISPIECVRFETSTQDSNLSSALKNGNDQYHIFMNEDFYMPVTDISQTCFNRGLFDLINHTCECKRSFNGNFCKKFLCNNYCFQGKCIILENGQPYCDCDPNYKGRRCEQSICSNYCLNDGECTPIDGKPHCTCKYSRGLRCEDIVNATEVCITICKHFQLTQGEIDSNVCNCEDINRIEQSGCNDDDQYPLTKTLSIIFFIITGVLLTIIFILSYIIFSVRRKPLVKKRFVVSKSGITPLTSGSSSHNQCEIVIENCCNMNLCETPCFDPALKKLDPNRTIRKKKELLLDNIEDNNIF